MRWEHEKNLLKQIRQSSEEIDKIKAETVIAERNGDLGRVSELKYGVLVEKQKQLEELKGKMQKIPSEQQLLKETVDEEMIAEVVAKWTGIPVSKLMFFPKGLSDKKKESWLLPMLFAVPAADFPMKINRSGHFYLWDRLV
jgi:ATP-dependent Clp protease ATP-binding subunit ClpA